MSNTIMVTMVTVAKEQVNTNTVATETVTIAMVQVSNIMDFGSELECLIPIDTYEIVCSEFRYNFLW